MRENLIKNGVENEIVDMLFLNLSVEVLINVVVNNMYKEIKNMLGAAVLFLFNLKFLKIVFFVGLIGVGKIIIIVKIAVKFMFEDGKKVGFIIVDIYRIAVVEQFKIYVEIMNIKIKVWYEVDEYDRIIESFVDLDVVFVDIVGRSYKNQEYMDEFKVFVVKVNLDEVFLFFSVII